MQPIILNLIGMLLVLILLVLAGSAFAQITPDNFTANFESGNVANVQQVGVDSFTYEIRLDDNAGDVYGWYYFAVINGSGHTVTLYLTNPDSWQNEECNPLYSIDKVNWQRVENIWRDGSTIVFSQYLAVDTVWFAQGFPFTVSQMYSLLDTLEQLPFISRETLGYSVHNRPVDMITITNDLYSDEYKKTAWLISRQHPMESSPTYSIRGMLDGLIDGSEFSAQFMKDIVLKVVPIVNVDGVAEGYSRHNVNGINLNRNWQPDFESEEPSVSAVHQAIDNYINDGNTIDLFIDFHAAMDYYDFGYRMPLDYVGIPYYSNQTTFIYLLETFDQWQDLSVWRYFGTEYPYGLSTITMYSMYSLDVYTPESPWTRRNNYEFITIESLMEQGGNWLEATYNYLWPLSVTDINGDRIDTLEIGLEIIPAVWDFDQRFTDSLIVMAECTATTDEENITLFSYEDQGHFVPLLPLATSNEPSSPNDGVLSLIAGGNFLVSYADPLIPARVSTRNIYAHEPTHVNEDKTPARHFMSNVYPNPFNSSTTVSYELPRQAQVKIEIYDILGRSVCRLFEGRQNAGCQSVTWHAVDVSSGIYFYKLQADDYIETRKILLVK